jgi:signal transduction histidine kinase
MMNAAARIHEGERIAELRHYRILDTPAEDAFDDLTKLAAYICGMPVSWVSLVDSARIWFKSKVGMAASQIPRIDGFCSSAILNESLLVVHDAAANERLASHPLVASDPKLRFYAGAPLITPRGHRVGTICVADRAPRDLNAGQAAALESLARTVVAQLEIRSSAAKYREARETIVELQARAEIESREREAQLKSSEKAWQILAGRVIRAQDDERRRIARELRDSTGQVLAALSVNIRQMQKEGSPGDSSQFEECRELAATASAEIRNLSYLLHPPLMDELGLAAGLSLYAQGIEKRCGLKVHVEVAADLGRLDANREVALLRIVQESLGHIHRHSGCATASVRIFGLGKNAVLEVRDQGRGLPIASGDIKALGVGIRSMQERLRPFGGNLQIESNETGTIVRAVLPRHSSLGLAAAKTA